MALSAIGSVATSAQARPKIFKSVATNISLSGTRMADGSIVAKAVYTSAEPRCLEAKRFKKLRDGYYHTVGGGLAHEKRRFWF